MADNEKQARKDEKQELSEKDMESVSGGVIEGGCIVYPPIIKRPTIPTISTTI